MNLSVNLSFQYHTIQKNRLALFLRSTKFTSTSTFQIYVTLLQRNLKLHRQFVPSKHIPSRKKETLHSARQRYQIKNLNRNRRPVWKSIRKFRSRTAAPPPPTTREQQSTTAPLFINTFPRERSAFPRKNRARL